MAGSSAQKLGTFCESGPTGAGTRPLSVYRAVESLPVDTATCFHHTDRPTGRSCTRCGRPACADCLRDAPVGSHCFECIRADRPPARQRLRMWNAAAGPLVTKVLIAVNVVAFVLTSADGALQTQL